jgi:hypothetical protein
VETGHRKKFVKHIQKLTTVCIPTLDIEARRTVPVVHQPAVTVHRLIHHYHIAEPLSRNKQITAGNDTLKQDEFIYSYRPDFVLPEVHVWVGL